MFQFFSLLLFVSSTLAATANQWRGRSIYQVVTDRFAVADNSSPTCDTGAGKYCGGTWQGIINHLDYIQGMGFDAVWISPVVANIEENTTYGEAFHGYWTRDMNSLNSHFGTADDLKSLSSALHSRGMYLMFDVVVNHMASATFPPDFSKLSPFSTASDYHPQCFITDYNNQTDVEQCWLGDKNLPLPDVKTEDPTIRKTYSDWISGLVKEYSVDGVRIDTVKHVEKDFWPGFASAAGVYTIGEVLSNDTTYTSPYTQVLDGVLDYPSWFTLVSAFSSPQGNLAALTSTATTIQKTFKNGAFLTGSFLENHDQSRFQSITTDQALVKNAMTWSFVHDGIPILYYGQEQGYTGGADPGNREALWFSAYQTEKPLVSHVKSLNAARKLAMTSNKNYLTTAAQFLSQQNSATLAISKPPLLTLLTNAGNQSSSSISWKVGGSDISALSVKGGGNLVDVLTCTQHQVSSDGTFTAQASGGMPMVLMPASVLSKNGDLCTSVATGKNGGIQGKQMSAWLAVGSAVVLGGLGGCLV